MLRSSNPARLAFGAVSRPLSRPEEPIRASVRLPTTRPRPTCETGPVTDFESLAVLPKALLSSVLELLAERKVNRPASALTLSPDDLASSWDLVAESAVLPDPPGEHDATEEGASAYWFEQALGDLLAGGFLLQLEDTTYQVPDLESLLRFRDAY